MSRWLADTSVSVPLVLTSHVAHDIVNIALRRRRIELPAHAALETYSVLTRLPGDARLRPEDAARLIGARFGRAVPLAAQRSRALVEHLAALGISGGAVYDALIAFAALDADATLVTRDARASTTYGLVKARVQVIIGPS